MESQTVLVFQNPSIRLGFHIGKQKTLFKSFDSVLSTPLHSYQIYISNGRSWQPPKPSVEDLRKTRYLLETNEKYACVHGCLLYNLAGSAKGKSHPDYTRNLSNTRVGLQAELDTAVGFGAGVVVHIGSFPSKEEGIKTIVKSIESVLTSETTTTKELAKGLQIPLASYKKARKIILENAAGEGTKIGSNLDEIATIINGVSPELKDQVKVCIDTAHIYGAGQYDFGDPDIVDTFFSDFDSKIGLDYLELFHLNDSRAAFGSRKDRHENLGIGYIFSDERPRSGLDGLKRLIDRCEDLKIPLVGEPPAKTADGKKAPGGIWDWSVVKSICNLEEELFVC